MTGAEGLDPGGADPDEPPTRVDGRSGRSPGPPDAESQARSVTMLAVLHLDAATRASAFGRSVAVLTLLGISFQPFIGRRSPVHELMTATLVALGIFAVYVHLRARDPKRYTLRLFRTFGFACAAAAMVFVYYQGVFSPVAVVIALGVAFFGQSDDPTVVTLLSGATIVGYLVLAALITGGILPDHGLYAPEEPSILERVSTAVMVAGTLVAALWQARLTRRATHDAIARSNDAVLLARQREVLLEEVHQDLDRALRAGAGRSGRHTGHRIGPWTLDEIIGQGAMGEVYAASHRETGQGGAVKLLHHAMLRQPDMLRRFARETEIASRIAAPNIVSVFDVGTLPDGTPYIVMERLHGRDLAYHLRQSPRMSLEEILPVLEDVARGLDAAHRAGIVHRDLKPQNIHATREEPPHVWKVLDFGVSKLFDSSGTLTEGAIVGTPGYMAPEQAQGHEVDPRADIFSLGAVAYRALTGRPPFSGPNMPQILFQVVYHAPTRPSEVAPVSRDIDRVIGIALAKSAAARFASASELVQALRAAHLGVLSPALRHRGDDLERRQAIGRPRHD